MTAQDRQQRCAQVDARRAAYHEAGHAVVGWRHGFSILKIDMTRGSVRFKYMVTHTIAAGHEVQVAPGQWELMVLTPDAEAREQLLPEAERHAQMLFAGNLAIRRRYPHVSITEATIRYGGVDIPRARNLSRAFHPNDEEAARQWFNTQWHRAARLLREPELWAAVEALAALLTPATQLPGAEAEAVIAREVRRVGRLQRRPR